MTDDQRPAPGLTPERVAFFTDAVFAIAMTLLVIEIPRPEGEAEFHVGDGVGKAEATGHLLRFLWAQNSSFVAYVLAFYLLWNAWRTHHRLFDRIDRLSPGLVRWHFPFLLVIGFLPYPTAVYGDHASNPGAAMLYIAVVGTMLTVRAGLQYQAGRDDLLRPGVDRAAFRRDNRISWTVAGYWLSTLALAWWTPWVIIAWVGSPVLAEVMKRRRTSNPDETPAKPALP